MNNAYFKNRLTTTKIEPKSPTFGSVAMKSNEMLSHCLSVTGNGSNSLSGFFLSTLSY